ncbi:MAG: hypothetical protein ACI8S6_000610 [Myxococcota bacterium]|jgi:hypothetical protein
MQLIDQNGDVRLGTFDEAVEVINHADYDLWTPMDRPAGWLRRRLGFNQFEFFGLLSDNMVVGAAISDVGYVSAAFAYLHNRESGESVVVAQKLPLGLGARLVQTPESGLSEFVGFGLRIEMSALGNVRSLRVRSRRLTIDATLSEGQRPPLRLCAQAGENGWSFTRKSAGHAITGTAKLRSGSPIALDGMRGIHDWSAGFMRRETFWSWAACSTTHEDGTVIGLNLSSGVNETGFSENVIWLDDTRHLLPQVRFRYDRRALDHPWQITDSAGRISLAFVPALTAHSERISALIVASNFRQIFGHYTGRIELDSGKVVTLQGAPGFAERHFARW